MWMPEQGTYTEDISESRRPGWTFYLMADMSSPNPEPFLVILLLEAIVGLSITIFIIICVPVTDAQRKSISTFNRILMALNVSNICFIITMSVFFLFTYVWPYLYTLTCIMFMICFMTMYSITSTSWLTSTLCLFYFLKIVPSQPGVPTKMKTMTSPIIGGLLLTSEVVSLRGSCLLIRFTNPNSTQMNSTECQQENLEALMTGRVALMDIVLALNGLPFFMMIVTTLTSALLLKHYNGQMKKKIGNTKVKDYWVAVQTMTALLMFYLIIFVSVVIVSLHIVNEKTWGYWICEMVLVSFPTVQSALLIYGNPKLKEALRRIFTFTTSTIGSGQ